MLLWAAVPPRMKYPLTTTTPVSPWNWSGFPSSPASFHTHPQTPAPPLPTASSKNSLPPHRPHHKKEQRGPPLSKIPYSSVNYKPASSTPDSRGPTPHVALCSFPLLMVKEPPSKLPFEEEMAKGLRQLHLVYQRCWDTTA